MALDTGPIRDAVISHALASGHFESVSGHEPKSAPGNGLTAAVWLQTIGPAGGQSGLRSTTARVVFTLRIYQNMLMEPQDDIDPMIDAARDALFTAYSADFTLDGRVRNVDLLGAAGVALSSEAGYLSIDNQMKRIVDITVPLIVNDVYEQSP